MSYRTIVVYLENESRAKALLEVAVALARRHSAHLIGVYAKPPIQVYGGAEVAVYLTDDHEEYYAKLSAKLKALFESATENEDFIGEWRYISVTGTSIADAITEIARTADLVVAGQRGPDDGKSSLSELPEQILMGANRPVLFVPPQGNYPTVGSNVFVAWDGGAAATRAIFDSLPALQLADEVTVHRINPAYRDRHRIIGIPSEMVQTLSRHDVNVELAESDARTSEIGSELISYAAEKGADMMVMGAYGHSRFREYVLGGVTRHVLDNMNMPVLMTHS